MDTKIVKSDKGRHVNLLLLLIAILVIAVIVFTGYRITKENTQNPSNTSLENTANNMPIVAFKDTSNSFTVQVPDSLLPAGSCKTNEVLLGIIYNSDSYDYDCHGIEEAINYASIVFGTSTQSIVSAFGSAQETEKVVLADEKTAATKSVVIDQAVGGDRYYTARYVIYEAISESTGSNYYAVYKTGVGFSDENKFLRDFEHLVTKGWVIP